MLSILVSENAKHSGLQKAGNFAFKLKNFCNCAYMRPEKKSILSKNTKLNAKFPKISSPECLAFSQTRMLSILPCKNAKHSAQFIGLKKKKKKMIKIGKIILKILVDIWEVLLPFQTPF